MEKTLSQIQKKDYEGSHSSTLCLGCGHDQISKALIQACYELAIDPFQIAKISGIGCSSKTPNYFLKSSRGFNTLHGRMASIATGVKIANKELKVIGISGDGDTGSIGLGSFLHTVRKNIPMIYILENNGVYGLTKGQFSPLAKKHSILKHREENLFSNLDLCGLALSTGCGFVARAFSGDKKQLNQLLKLALDYEGFAFLDVISPCVAYGNEKEFSHSFPFMKHKNPLQDLDIIFEKPAVEIDIKKGDIQQISLSKNHFLRLKKLCEKNHNPTQKTSAWNILEKFANKKEILTGLIYYKKQKSFLKTVGLNSKALVKRKEQDVRLKNKDLKKILKSYS